LNWGPLDNGKAARIVGALRRGFYSSVSGRAESNMAAEVVYSQYHFVNYIPEGGEKKRIIVMLM
jgi:hypothetical protein